MNDKADRQRLENAGQGEGGAQFDRIVAKVVAWVEDRLNSGESANPDWHPDIEAWSASSHDGDDEAPPILLGELMTRLTDPNYGGFPPGTFALRKPGNLSQNIAAGGSVQFEWDKSTNVYFYEFEVSLDPQFIDPPVYKNAELAHVVDLPTGTLKPGKQYFWRVTAKNSKGMQQAVGNPFSFMTKG
ncbi:MAG: hypothetical protein KDA21_03900 [Phycisphaerales bacterium]|nr:hypothetical protein [Phycisphaerales bacterium]